MNGTLTVTGQLRLSEPAFADLRRCPLGRFVEGAPGVEEACRWPLSFDARRSRLRFRGWFDDDESGILAPLLLLARRHADMTGSLTLRNGGRPIAIEIRDCGMLYSGVRAGLFTVNWTGNDPLPLPPYALTTYAEGGVKAAVLPLREGRTADDEDWRLFDVRGSSRILEGPAV